MRLDFHVETPRGLKQVQQKAAEGDVLDGAREHRLAHGADRRLELLDARARRNPAGAQVGIGHGMIVAIEKREEIFREIALVLLAQRAHDPEIHRAVLALGRDEDITRMHVGVEKPVAERLREENLHTVVRQPPHVDAGGLETLDVADGYAMDALEHHDRAAGEVPVDLRNVKQVGAFEVGAQATRIRRLHPQVELVVDGLVEFIHHFDGPKPACIRHVAHGQAREQKQQFEVALDDRLDAGAQHLDRHFTAVVQPRDVHLCHRGRGDGLAAEFAEEAVELASQRLLDQTHRLIAGKRRHAILKPRQFLGDVFRQQVGAGGQHLAEFHEHRPQFLQRLAQAHAARQTAAREQPPWREPQQQTIGTEKMDRGDELVQIMPDEDLRDAQQARELARTDHFTPSRKRSRRDSRRSASNRSASTACRNASAREREGNRRLSSRRYSAASSPSTCSERRVQPPRWRSALPN